jgi:NhaP-type Na+/H+ or K+/H+ antiporter
MFEIGIILAVIVALSQLAKNLGTPAKFIPLVNIVLGLAAGLFVLDIQTVQEQIMTGLMIGLSASGLFDQTKVVTKK